jgi:hypothetical protein
MSDESTVEGRFVVHIGGQVLIGAHCDGWSYSGLRWYDCFRWYHTVSLYIMVKFTEGIQSREVLSWKRVV